MADIVTSVLARLKNKAKESGRSISFVCNSSVRRSFCAAWKSQSMLRTSC